MYENIILCTANIIIYNLTNACISLNSGLSSKQYQKELLKKQILNKSVFKVLISIIKIMSAFSLDPLFLVNSASN